MLILREQSPVNLRCVTDANNPGKEVSAGGVRITIFVIAGLNEKSHRMPGLFLGVAVKTKSDRRELAYSGELWDRVV